MYRYLHTIAGANVRFTNWESGPPPDGRYCVHIGGPGPHKALWNGKPCIDTKGYVCEKLKPGETSGLYPTTTHDPRNCPPNTLEIDNTCFFVCFADEWAKFEPFLCEIIKGSLLRER